MNIFFKLLYAYETSVASASSIKTCLAPMMTTADEFGPAHDLLVYVLLACAQKPPLNAHAGISSEARSKFGFGSSSTYPNFVYVSSEGSGQSAQTCLSLHRLPM